MNNLFSQKESKHEWLVSRGAKGEIRCFELWYEQLDDEVYVIHRQSCQLGGKITNQPDIIIDCGKVNRSAEAQCILQFNHLVKEKHDKGYKPLDKSFNEYTTSELNQIIGEHITNSEGILKPMLAKSETQIKNRKIFDRKWYASRKINGIRTLVYYKDEEIHTASRGGSMNYDFVLSHILTHPKLIKYFEKNPNVILDSEAFKFGWTLNRISGICRTQKTAYDGDPLELYVYDIADVEKPFEKRLEIINNFAEELQLGFNPEKEWSSDDLKIQIVPQILISGENNIKNLHDQWVSEGWEGLVLRDPNVVYKPGARGNHMNKWKSYFDAEYKIVGLSEGLREEDMCFIMETSEGQQFNCKPIGDREQKQWYRTHLNELIGKMATVKYFEMSGKEGSVIPQQPVMISIRDYE